MDRHSTTFFFATPESRRRGQCWTPGASSSTAISDSQGLLEERTSSSLEEWNSPERSPAPPAESDDWLPKRSHGLLLDEVEDPAPKRSLAALFDEVADLDAWQPKCSIEAFFDDVADPDAWLAGSTTERGLEALFDDVSDPEEWLRCAKDEASQEKETRSVATLDKSGVPGDPLLERPQEPLTAPSQPSAAALGDLAHKLLEELLKLEDRLATSEERLAATANSLLENADELDEVSVLAEESRQQLLDLEFTNVQLTQEVQKLQLESCKLLDAKDKAELEKQALLDKVVRTQTSAEAVKALMDERINDLQCQLRKASEDSRDLKQDLVKGLATQLVSNVTLRLLNRQKASQLRAEVKDLSAQLSRSCSAQEVLAEQLQASTKQLTTLQKELVNLCTCPVSFKLMQQPVLGSDLRTYEKDAIEEALSRRAASPFTRLPMQKTHLRPNKLGADLLELLAKHFPVLEDGSPVDRPLQVHPVTLGFDLIEAIVLRKAKEAVEILHRDISDAFLNLDHHVSGLDESMNLLQLSIYHRLPEVACALLWRPDFRKTESYSSKASLGGQLSETRKTEAVLFECFCRWALWKAPPWHSVRPRLEFALTIIFERCCVLSKVSQSLLHHLSCVKELHLPYLSCTIPVCTDCVICACLILSSFHFSGKLCLFLHARSLVAWVGFLGFSASIDLTLSSIGGGSCRSILQLRATCERSAPLSTSVQAADMQPEPGPWKMRCSPAQMADKWQSQRVPLLRTSAGFSATAQHWSLHHEALQQAQTVIRRANDNLSKLEHTRSSALLRSCL